MAVRQSSVRGFTLIELLLVLVILTILSSVVIVQVNNHRKRADIAATKTNISNYETALGAFQVDCGRYPTNEEGLSVLTSNPGLPAWSGPYVKIVVPDRWGNDFIYRAPGAYLPDSFDLYSSGPDGQQDSADDIVNWRS